MLEAESHKSRGALRRKLSTLYVPVVTLLLSWCTRRANTFSPPMSRTFHLSAQSTPRTKLLVSQFTTREETLWLSGSTSTTSWSKPDASNSNGAANAGSSRFGVRRRVKAVLEKAKSRTGLVNRNSDASVVAEAASIGGLYESADLVVLPTLPKNGYNNGAAISPKRVEEALQEVQGRGPLRNGTDSDLVLESAVRQPYADQSDRLQVDVVLSTSNVENLPFKLPRLSGTQLELLRSGERVQEQSKMGREGSGFVVVDVKAPPFVVWECLLDFEKYPEYIGTVRSMTMFTNSNLKQSYIAEKPVLPGTGRETRHYGTASITRASFVLSKFQLKIAAVHKYRPHPDGHYMEFSLDKACKNVVLQDAKGIWYTENEPEGRKGYTRVWLLCELSVSRLLPTFIVDYAAKRAMPRASNWIKPTVEALKQEFNIQDDGVV
jgi:hypothetical protein